MAREPHCKRCGKDYPVDWPACPHCGEYATPPAMLTSKEQVYARAIERIRQILADDKNYQADSLKLGGIWDVCDTSADYRRGKHSEGTFVEILEKGSAVETPAPLTYVTKVEPHHDRMAIGGRIVMMEQVYDKLGIPRPALKTSTEPGNAS